MVDCTVITKIDIMRCHGYQVLDSTVITDVAIMMCPTAVNDHACVEAYNTNHLYEGVFVVWDKEHISCSPFLHDIAFPPSTTSLPSLFPVLSSPSPPLFPVLIIKSTVCKYFHETKYYLCNNIFQKPYQFYYCFINNSSLVNT